MPAAELTRLRTQINSLIIRFNEPQALRLALRDLLDQYANRAYRPGQAVKPQPLLPSYRVAPLIMRQLELELGKTCQEQPQAALNVVEALWHDPYLEPRLLAAHLLGSIPATMGVEVIEKLRAWARPDENFRMLEALFTSGTRELRRSNPQLLLGLFEEWITDPHTDYESIGLRGLEAMINDREFENLPAVFRLVSPLVLNAPMALHVDLQVVIEALARRTPTETVYLLRQALSMSVNPATARLIRRCLPVFGPDQQSSLRAALQTASST